MFAALIRAINQLGDKKFQKVILFGIAGAVGVFVGLWILAGWAVAAIAWSELPWIGGLLGWFPDWVGEAAFLVTMLIVMFLLFPAVMTGVVSIFLDDIVKAVEDKHYPALPQAKPLPLSETIGGALKFLGLVVGLNLLALPLYAILFFIPPLNIILYYLLNGYLVGREFYEMVAFRRLSQEDARDVRKAHKGKITATGAMIAFGMTVPILNLLTPVLAAATMVHVFEGLPRRHTKPDRADPETGPGPSSTTKPDTQEDAIQLPDSNKP